MCYGALCEICTVSDKNCQNTVVGITPAASTCTHVHVYFPPFLISSSCKNLSYTLGLLLLHVWMQTSVSWHFTWLEHLCFNISKRCKLPCVFRRPSRLHSANLTSQRGQCCRTHGHRWVVKYFNSEKCWMRTGVLWDVFLISPRQSGSFS